MRRIIAAFFLAALCCACTTIQIPLPGASIMRPRAGLGKVGARITTGAVAAPTVEGAIDEVKDLSSAPLDLRTHGRKRRRGRQVPGRDA